MNKKQLKLFLFSLSMVTYQSSFAHDGGGSGSSYNFDKRDLSAESNAEKKAVEKKQDEDTWDDFMKAVNAPSNEGKSEKKHNHAEGASAD